MNLLPFTRLSALIGRKAGSAAASPEILRYLERVGEWREIYGGGGGWRYAKKGGIDGGTRRVAALNAARAICAELAALVFSQQVDFYYKDEKTRRFVLEVLQKNRFWSVFPIFLERMLALGGGVVKCYAENGEVKLDFVGGDGFIPTQYDEKGVYGGVIVGRIFRNEPYMLAETHERNGDGYTITNRLYKGENADKEIELGEIFPDLSAETVVKGLKKPLFTYFRPSSADADGSPLGTSVFAGATDTLRALDIAADSLEREFVLGKKRIIVPVSAIRGEYDRDGKLKKYFDSSDEVYQAFSADDKEELKITDNSVELRIEEHVRAIDALLDLLCMQLGLTAGTLSYVSGGVKTAAEVVSRENKTYRTKSAHQQLVREGLIDVCENITMLGAAVGAIDFTEEIPEISFGDSIMQDNGAKIDNAIKLFKAGLLDKEQALREITMRD